MSAIDLSSCNLGELKGLQVDIEKEIKNRQQQELKKARGQILSIAQGLGVSVEELLANGAKQSKATKGPRAQPRYKNPSDDSLTWSGRGRQPKWIADGLANGKTLEEFRI